MVRDRIGQIRCVKLVSRRHMCLVLVVSFKMGLRNNELAFLLVVGAGMSTSLGAAVVYSERLVELASKKILAGGLGT